MAKSTLTDIRGNRTSKLLGYLAGLVMKLWGLTLRYQVTDHAGITRSGEITTPVVFALWHNRIFSMPPIWKKTGGKNRQSVVLTSASKDGHTLATAMSMFGLGAIRGSSSRRAVAALVAMKRALKDGLDVSITPDGPRGPRYIVQPGVIKLAQSAAVPIVPIHLRFSKAWHLKSWDRFVIPVPFSRIHLTFGKILHIPKHLDPETFETLRLQLQNTLLQGSDDT